MTTYEPRELEELLLKAYEQAPKKSKFLMELSQLPGVECSHQSNLFCHGYLKCVTKNNLPQNSIVISLTISVHGMSFVLSDQKEFACACEKMSEYRRKNPEKILLQMLVSRLANVKSDYKSLLGSSFHKAKQIIEPVLSSKEAVHDFINNVAEHYSLTKSHRKLKKLVSQTVIPDKLYHEAWDVLQVKDVMES